MQKQWVTVYRHRGYDIQVLSGAEMSDTFGYKISRQDETIYNTVDEAVFAINTRLEDQ